MAKGETDYAVLVSKGGKVVEKIVRDTYTSALSAAGNVKISHFDKVTIKKVRRK